MVIKGSLGTLFGETLDFKVFEVAVRVAAENARVEFCVGLCGELKLLDAFVLDEGGNKATLDDQFEVEVLARMEGFVVCADVFDRCGGCVACGMVVELVAPCSVCGAHPQTDLAAVKSPKPEAHGGLALVGGFGVSESALEAAHITLKGRVVLAFFDDRG